MSAEIPPEALANALLRGGSGYFILDALTIRRSVVGKAGLMREDLSLHQDTEWILRTAMSARLLPGSLNEPVACWRVHGQNRISAPRSAKQKLDDQMRMLRCLYVWCRQNAGQYQGSLMDNVGNALSSGRWRLEPAPARRKFMRARNLMSFLPRSRQFLWINTLAGAPGQLNLSPKEKTAERGRMENGLYLSARSIIKRTSLKCQAAIRCQVGVNFEQLIIRNKPELKRTACCLPRFLSANSLSCW